MPVSAQLKTVDQHGENQGPANSLVALLHRRALQQTQQRAYTFLSDGEHQAVHISYGDLDRQARTIAAKLLGLGLQGRCALLLYPQGLDYIVAFFGCLYAGVVAVPAYPPRNSRHLPRLQGIIADCQAAVILSNQATAASLGQWFGASPNCPILETDTFDQADARLPDISPQDVAFLQYTSGSTGAAKGVVLTHANLMANQALIKQGFGHGPHATVVGWLPLYHDMGLIGNVMQPLFAGAPVVLMPPMAFLEKPLRWLQAISDYGAHTSGGPNFAFDLCVQKISDQEKSRLDLSAWQVAFNGAEPIHAPTLERFAKAFAGCGFQRQAFYPCYGLAEATLLVTGGGKTQLPTVKAFDKAKLAEGIASTDILAADDVRHLVGCGFAGDGHQLRIVDTDTQAVCGAGRIGEIQVSGASVSQGYWQNAKATANTFCQDGHQHLWLRTGDLGFIDDGELFVSGRIKDLIIIRGRNYYPHDLEMAVASVACLLPNAIAAFSVADAGREKLIVLAELKRGHLRQADFSAAFAAIRARLVDECGIQADSVVLLKPGAVLKTSSGKIRRNACKEAFIGQQLAIVAMDGLGAMVADTPVESEPALDLQRQALLAMAPEAAASLLAGHVLDKIQTLSGLAKSQLDMLTPVLSFGIDSLKAMELKYALDDLLKIDLPITLLLSDYSALALASQALALAQPKPALPMPEPSAPSANGPRLSLGQQAIWTVCQFEAHTVVYNLPILLRITGTLDIDAFRHALQGLVDRHELLRTRYQSENGLLVPMPVAPGAIGPLFMHITCKDEQDRDCQISAQLRRPFDMGEDAMLRAALFGTADDDVCLLFCVHHIAVDFRSWVVLLAELKALYSAYSQGLPASLPPLQASYQDYINWQHDYLESKAAGLALDYWQGQLAGELPKLQWPLAKSHLDKSHQGQADDRGGIETLLLDADLTQRLKAFAAQQGVTLYMLLLAVFKVLLHRYSGQQDIIVGSPMIGRPKQDFAQVVGYFVNPVALRSYPEGDKPFIRFLQEVKQTVLGALRHQDYPQPLLVDKLRLQRGLGLTALYRVCFVLQGDAGESAEAAALALGLPDCPLDWQGVAVKTAALPETVAPFDINLMMALMPDGLAASFQYRHGLLAHDTVIRMIGHFQCLLQGVLANPALSLGALPLLTEPEYRQVMAWNAPIASPDGPCLHQLFETQVLQTPNAVAVVYENQSLSYAELNAKANQWAHFLRGQGVVADTLVGLCVTRSLTMIVGLLGILKSGGAYLPLDPDYPKERLAYTIADAQPLIILTEQAVATVLPTASRLFCLDDEEAALPGWQSRANPVNIANPHHLAYVIYTSGSTGNPKGVAVSHQNVRRLFTVAGQVFDFSADDVWSLFHSFAFDFSVWEIWGALVYGGKLVIVPYWVSRSPDAFHALLSAQGVTVLNQTPSSFYQLAAFDGLQGNNKPLSLRWVIFGGEALEPWRLQAWLQNHAGAGPRLVNMYGITETTVHVTHYRLDADDSGLGAIGRPLADLQAFILDPQLNPVPVGVVGELYIGGAGLARGYLNRPELTAERFIPNPYGSGRLYRTGDLACHHADGTIDYQGRIDSQVKIRGFRIELGEIEAWLLRHADIKEAAVLLKEEPDNHYLAAYVTVKGDTPPDTQDLKAFLKQSLPDYMVPAVFIVMAAMPLTANGKLDRQALLAMAKPIWQAREFTPPRDEAEQAIADIWQAILGVERLGVYDDFFELGGHSLSAVQIVTKIKEAFAIDVPVKTVFEAPTIAEFVDRVAEYQMD